MKTIAEALERGRRCQAAGQLGDAIEAYRAAVELDPQHLPALIQLGELHLVCGKPGQAVEWLSRALSCDASRPTIHLTLGEAYRRLGDVNRAVACNQDALRQSPDYVPALSNLGLLAWQQGNLEQAAEYLRRQAQIIPNDPRAWMMLGDLLLDRGETAESERCLRRAVELSPANPDCRARLAHALQASNQLQAACDQYAQLSTLRPQDSQALVNLAVCHQRLGDAARAEAIYRRALAIDASCAPAHGNLGALLVSEHRGAEAIEYCRRAVELRPQLAEAYVNLANGFEALGKPDDAIEACRRGLALNPNVSLLHCNLGFSCREIGLVDESLAAFREAVRLDPTDPEPHSNLVYTLNFLPGASRADVLAAHRLWAQLHAEALTRESKPHSNQRVTDRRLRVGYVSSHFRGHAVNFFIEPILAAHDHESFEVFCYSGSTPGESDATTERLQGYVDHWRKIAAVDDDSVARQVREDQVDILVDLAGHIAGNRLGVFARKPAPVQVSYLGYQNTTGMSAIDYRLTDDWSDPPGDSDVWYSEKLIRLAGSFFCYLPSTATETSLPSLSSDHPVTFASFNHFAKVNSIVLDTWGRILAAVPGSRILLLAPDSSDLKHRVLTALARHNVAHSRIEIVPRQPYAEYLKIVARGDIALDPFPFNGHTTTCDCLWMGVPVISLTGQTYASRFGSSALATLGLRELTADTVEGYIDAATRLAVDLEKRRHLRATLRQRMASSPLLDFAGFTRDLEAAYRDMWRHWCNRSA